MTRIIAALPKDIFAILFCNSEN